MYIYVYICIYIYIYNLQTHYGDGIVRVLAQASAAMPEFFLRPFSARCACAACAAARRFARLAYMVVLQRAWFVRFQTRRMLGAD